jgi:quercetin dioxygenase-like cupin family protein
MITRRLFATCALCAVAGFSVTDAGAQTPGFARKVLKQTDGPTDGYVTIAVEVEIQPGAFVDWHTHPGLESGYLVAGGGELLVKGEAGRQIKAGDVFQVTAGIPHALKNGATATKVSATYVIEKGKPLASPAPAPT